MTNVERFEKFFHFDKTIDRLPVIEWATWWDQTIGAWKAQGLPEGLGCGFETNAYFGQDNLRQFWIPARDMDCPQPSGHGAPLIWDEKDYRELKKYLYTDRLLEELHAQIKAFRDTHEEYAYWLTLDGYFWHPRNLFGIENHFYAFYDVPELMLEINSDLADFHKRALDMVYDVVHPVFMTFAEDMSYNHGPMLSREQYDKFMLPFYRKVIPVLKAHDTRVLIDTDGFVEPLIPWFLEGGIEGILPLERMAGVDVNRIREAYPDLLMIGGYDKTIMHKGEDAMRAEFERLKPAILSGGYIPSVDHQTPPDVTLEQYRVFMRLLREYCAQ